MALKTRNSLVGVLTVVALVLSCRSIADVTVQEQTTFNVSVIKARVTSTQRTAGDRQRTETEVRCDGMMSLLCGKNQQTDIVRLDRGVIWKIEPKKKRYAETPIPTPEQRRAAAERLRAALEKLKSCPQARRAADIDASKCELSSPKLTVDKTDDVANLAGHDAQRTNLKLTQSCNGKEPGSQPCELTYSLELWLAREEIPGLADRREFQRRYLNSLGLAEASAANSAQIGQYLAPYADVMKQLSEKAADLKGYPLKTTFRFAYAGAPCGVAAAPATASASSGALSSAGQAAGVAGANSAEQAARWGTIDAVSHSTGSSVGGYVAGSAVGAFAGSVVGGLFAKKPKPQEAKPAPDAGANNTAAPTTVAELTVETTALNADPVPAEQFEVPADWTKRVADTNAESQLPSCPTPSP